MSYLTVNINDEFVINGEFVHQFNSSIDRAGIHHFQEMKKLKPLLQIYEQEALREMPRLIQNPSGG
jgi:hypothetical protein